MRLRTLGGRQEIVLRAKALLSYPIRRLILRRGSLERQPVITIAFWSLKRGECAARLSASELAELIARLFALIVTSRTLKNALREPLKQMTNINIDSVRVDRKYK